MVLRMVKLFLHTLKLVLGAQEHSLLAAGHDSGMIVFKLERERPAMTINDGGGPNSIAQVRSDVALCVFVLCVVAQRFLCVVVFGSRFIQGLFHAR